MARHPLRSCLAAALIAVSFLACASSPESSPPESSPPESSSPVISPSESTALGLCPESPQSTGISELSDSLPPQDPPLCPFTEGDLSTGIVLGIEGMAPITSATLFDPSDLTIDEVAAAALSQSGSAVVQEPSGEFDTVILLHGDAFCYIRPTVTARMEGDVVVVSVETPPTDAETACDFADVDIGIGLKFDRSAGFDSIVEYRG